MVLSEQVDFSDRNRVRALMDGAIELFGDGVKRDGVDLYLLDKEELGTVATMMTNVATGKIVLVINAE